MRWLTWRYGAGVRFEGAAVRRRCGRKRRPGAGAVGLALKSLETRLVPSFVGARL